MSNEVELKLFFKAQDYDFLVEVLNTLPQFQPRKNKFLKNSYFDTPELQLRQWDMGLRIRGFEDGQEQTIKTRGQVVGGIHSRPEYNCAIKNANTPDLSLFPEAIWPQGAQLSQVQQGLYCLFETNFQRQTWQVSQGNSQVEVALDRGEIKAADRQEALCELELELLQGDVSALLILAAKVAEKVPVRLGKASKAQRGYRLAGKSKPVSLGDLKTLHLIPYLLAPSIETETLKQQLSLALENWQILDSLLCESARGGETAPLWRRFTDNFELMNVCLTGLNWQGLQTTDYWQLIESEINDKGQLESQWHNLAYGQAQIGLVTALLA